MINIFHESDINESQYIIATYDITTTKDLAWAAFQLAVGQSVGNPNVRNHWETDELFQDHSCLILNNEKYLKLKNSGKVVIAFPVSNINMATDGVSHLLCMLMGGQTDIQGIESCRLIGLQLPKSILDYFKGPKFGLKGARKLTGQYNKPLLGGIIKPKTGVSADTLAKMVQELVDGGVDFIKEDEIMSNPNCCPLSERLKVIVPIIKKSKVIYCYCINGDPHQVLENAYKVYSEGGNGIHVNFWSGMGIYRDLRNKDYPLFLHCQTSGNKILTDSSHRFSIDHMIFTWLCSLSGVDFFHAGMIGGYGGYDPGETAAAISILRDVDSVPALSCGMHPGLVDSIRKQIGNDWMANCGGSIHGHPGGTVAGAKAMRQSIDGTGGLEYDIAIEKWGKV